MYEIEIASMIISLICVAISARHGKPTKDQTRRFLKLLLTGKYEEPIETKGV